MLRKLLKRISRAIRRRQILISGKSWLASRRRDVLSSLLSPASPLADRPYIEGGLYEWYVEEKIELDYFFPPEKGKTALAVLVTGKHHGPYSVVERDVPSRSFWQAQLEHDFFIKDVCIRAGVPLLVVTPDDPVDPFSLAVQVRSLTK